MILVVGGVASGKRTYARSLGYGDADMGMELADGRPVLVDAQDLVRDGNVDVAGLAAELAVKEVVLCREVGSGIVPLSADDRAWRERVGALAGALAARADAVVRLSCGIPQVLKGADWLGRNGLPPHSEPHSPEGPEAGASFFANRACKHFPCHEGVDERDFNCLFCYCPLYALGPDCGGDFTYTKTGRKNCKGCAIPHVRDNGARLVAAHYEELAALAAGEKAAESRRS